jgi:hypothetical protein
MNVSILKENPMRPIRSAAALVAITSAALLATPSHAALLLGDTLSITFEFPRPTGTVVQGPWFTTVAVGSADAVATGQQFARFLVDAEDTTITFEFMDFGAAFGQGRYRIAGIDALLDSVELVAFGTTIGLDQTDVSLDNNDILVNFAGFSVGDSRGIRSGFVLTLNDTSQPVPEPASAALVLAGLLALGAAGRRRSAGGFTPPSTRPNPLR